MDAEARKTKELAAIETRAKAEEAKILAAAKEEAERKYEASLAAARKQAAEERERILAVAKKAAEAERQEQIARWAATAETKAAAADSPSPAELGLGKTVSPQLRRAIDAAMADARKKGQDREGQLRAALDAIKAHRGSDAPVTKAKAAGTRPAETALDAAVAKPELKEIIEIAMTNARSEGKSYQGQVQAALDAVKLYRDRETQGGQSPEADRSQTSAMLLGPAQADPELQRVIDEAMMQARAKGEDYAGQVRAALAAIKAHRARMAYGGAK